MNNLDHPRIAANLFSVDKMRKFRMGERGWRLPLRERRARKVRQTLREELEDKAAELYYARNELWS